MAKTYKSHRAQINSEIFNFSKALSPEDDKKFAFANAYVKFYGPAHAELSIKEITYEQAVTIHAHLKSLSINHKNRIDTAPFPPPQKEVGEAQSSEISPAQKSALIAIFNSRYDGNYKKIFEGLKKYAPGVIKKMTEADVRNTYLVSFWNVITFTEAHQLIKRFDAVRKGEKRDDAR